MPSYGIPATYDLDGLRAIHGHLFQDVYEWAGQVRTVDIAKGKPFLPPEAKGVTWREGRASSLSPRSHRLWPVTEPRRAPFGSSVARVSTAPGCFVCFEGGDGAGKSTQVRLLTDELQRRGHHVVVTRQPGGTPLGAQIRELVLHGEHVSPRAEALLFAADKAHHVDELIRPQLEAGHVVITDRYTDSSIAYQGAGRDLGADEIRDLQLWAVAGVLPDITFVLDVQPEIGRRRRGALPDRLESETDGFHQAVRHGFLDLAARDPERYVVLDAGRPPDEIHTHVIARIDEALGAAR